MVGLATGRRIVLGLSSLVFAAIAVGSLVAPATMAKPLGYELSNTTALSEFRAVYVGLWLAHSLVLAWAAWRIERPVLGDVGGILILGQVVGRLISLGLDGLPGGGILPVAVAELMAGLLIFVLRPRSRLKPTGSRQ